MGTATTGPGGLRHLGLLYDAPEDFADVALPELRAALERGDDVTVVADRRMTRAVRDRLGAVADRAHFPAPGRLVAAGMGSVRELREAVPAGPGVRAGGRALLISQSDLTPGSDRDFASIEHAVDPVLDGLPLTVICCYGRSAEPGHAAVCRRVHRGLVTADGVVDNPDFRDPGADAHLPLSAAAVPTLWVAFRDTSDLRRLRDGVRSGAAEAGLRGDAAEAAVLAVHEAAVLACTARGAGLDAGAEVGDCVLEVHVESGALTSEVRAPTRLDGAGDPVAHIRPFCRSISLHEERVVRVHVDADGPPGPA